MKKSRVFYFFIAVGAAAALAGKVTRERQIKAQKEGRHIPYGVYEAVIKEPLDRILAGIALIVLSPMMIFVALLVKRKLGSPILFFQDRPGLNEKIFKILKFRTMTNSRRADGELLPDEIRLTSFGKILRSTSLDELPELINILKGEMAIVGPRPQLVCDMVFMKQDHRKRHEVKPGLTGLAQVNGRNEIEWEKKLDYDLEYIKKITFIEDVKIILKTIGKVFLKDGINEIGCATALDYGDYLLERKMISREEYEKKLNEAKLFIEGKGHE